MISQSLPTIFGPFKHQSASVHIYHHEWPQHHSQVGSGYSRIALENESALSLLPRGHVFGDLYHMQYIVAIRHLELAYSQTYALELMIRLGL